MVSYSFSINLTPKKVVGEGLVAQYELLITSKEPQLWDIAGFKLADGFAQSCTGIWALL